MYCPDRGVIKLIHTRSVVKPAEILSSIPGRDSQTTAVVLNSSDSASFELNHIHSHTYADALLKDHCL